MLRRDVGIGIAGIALNEQGIVVAVQVVGRGVHVEPLAVHIHEVPGVVACADGDTWDVSRPAQEAERSGIGAAGCF